MAAFALPECGTQPRHVADRAQGLVADDDAEIGEIQRPLIRRRRNSRDIEDHVVKLLAQRRYQCLDRVGGKLDIVAQRLLGAQHKKTVADRRHDAFEEGAVDARRVDQRFAQPGGGLDVDRQRAIAVLQIEIDKCHATGLAVGEMPGEVDRERRRSDAAPRADNGDHRTELLVDRAAGARARPGAQRPRQQLSVQWLDDVLGNPGPQEVAIETDLVAVADGDDRDAGLANLGKGVDLRYREVDAGDVDDQDVG